jgi:hypothetical protein
MLLALFCLPTILFGAQTGSFQLGSGSSSVIATVQQTDRTVMDFQLDRLDYELSAIEGNNLYRISLPDDFVMSRGAFLGPGNAILPTVTRLIAVPFDSDPSLRVTRSGYVDFNGITLAAADAEESESLPRREGESFYRFQSELVTGEAAGTMRDLRLYAITISPVHYDTASGRLRVYDDIQIEISHPGTQMTRHGEQISEAFAPIYKSILDNTLVFDPVQITRGAYWIIYPDPYLANVLPIADWKKSKGYAVELIPKSHITPMTYTGIRNYLLARFDSCLVKPDYIVIVGDVTMPNGYGIPTRPYSNSYGTGYSDNFYSFLHGNDYFPEVLIGRISIRSTTDLQSYIDKLFSYERTPYMTQTDWYLRATVVAGSDGGNFISPRLTKLWCRERMMDSGFTQVDTLFATYYNDIPPSEINASIDNGIAFVNYRGYGGADGWVPPYYNTYDMQELSNGPMYPIMTSIVCGTGDFSSSTDPCFGEAWIRYNNKGGAGFIGNTNHDAHTRWTNALDVGIYWGWFTEGLTTLAQAEFMGKMNVYYCFPAYRNIGDQVDLYFNTYNDLGDPEVNCWTAVPRQMTVTFPDSVAFGQNRLDVHIQDVSGVPLAGAVVCLWKGDEAFVTEFTGADGTCEFAINLQTPGIVKLTATAKNFMPLEDSVIFYPGGVTVSYLSHIVDDDSTGESIGDGDGVANPSETIELPIMLENFGQSDTAFGVTASITSEYQGIEILRGTAGYSAIAPGDSASSVLPFLIHVRSDAVDGVQAPLLIDISDTGGHSWHGITTHLTIAAAQLVVDSIYVLNDDDGTIDPGETVDLVLKVLNSGRRAIRGATANLRVSDSTVRIIDSLAVFGDCEPGNAVYNTDDHYTIQVDSGAFNGHLVNFKLDFAGQGPQVVLSGFFQQVGVIHSYDPIGPDHYGYYCFDNTDTAYQYHPVYNWIDINIAWPYVVLADDDVATISLPFDVKYYGQTYTQITICDNGYIAMGDTWWANFFNAPIPGPQDAEAMIAPFWDDISQTGLRIYHYYDSANGWFVLGWKNAYDGDNNRNQTFEIIILDESVWPTITQDNEIIFQYNLVQTPTSVSVGICSPDRRDGIQYLFDNSLTRGAANLVNGRAIRFTTGSLYSTASDNEITVPAEVSLTQNYPNPFNPSTTIEFSIPIPQAVRIDVFNVLGQKVETVLDRSLPAGSHSFTWNARGKTSGVYFYRLATPDKVITRRMTLLK